MEVMKMAAGPDYKDDDEGGRGEYTPESNRSEHSYEFYVDGAPGTLSRAAYSMHAPLSVINARRQYQVFPDKNWQSPHRRDTHDDDERQQGRRRWRHAAG